MYEDVAKRFLFVDGPPVVWPGQFPLRTARTACVDQLWNFGMPDHARF